MSHRIGVVGAGYVGLTSAACLAHLGHEVMCADIDEEKVRRLSKGEIPFLERQLPVLVSEGLDMQRLRFVVGAAEAAAGAEFVLLCVPTPQTEDGSADLSYVESVTREIAPVLPETAIVVVKSTSPVGTTRMVQRLLDESGAPPGVKAACNPEFLREGNAVHDFLHPDRIVIGSDDPETAISVSSIFRGIQAPIVTVDPVSAEMVKYASNAYLAGRVSFINAIANLCETVGADVKSVALGMGYDTRIGSEFLHPGPGYGGSCFPKDTAALLATAREVGLDLPPVRATIEVNAAQRERIIEKIERAVGRPWNDATVAVWGLTFKADTDDLRDSPALEIVETLRGQGATVRAFDPVAGEAAARLVPGLEISPDAYTACEGADVLAVLTEWDEFRWLDFHRVAEIMRRPSIVDARNLLDPPTMHRLSFAYVAVGR